MQNFRWLAQQNYQLPTCARESLSVGGEQVSSRVHAGFSACVGVYTRFTTTGTQAWSFTSSPPPLACTASVTFKVFIFQLGMHSIMHLKSSCHTTLRIQNTTMRMHFIRAIFLLHRSSCIHLYGIKWHNTTFLCFDDR